MGAADVLDAADRNFWELFERMVANVPRGSRREQDGVLMLSSGLPAAFFNPAFVTGPVEDADAVVHAVDGHYRDLGLPYVLLFREDRAPGVAAACASAGLIEHWRLPLMLLDPIPSAARRPDGLEVETVDSGNLHEYAGVLSEGFGMPLEMAQALAEAMPAVDGLVGLLGRIDGRAVATSAVFVTDALAGVYNVAVPEAHRRRGLGEALTAAAAEHGVARGARRATLQASEAGEPVYRRMGYVTVDHYRQFEPAPR